MRPSPSAKGASGAVPRHAPSGSIRHGSRRRSQAAAMRLNHPFGWGRLRHTCLVSNEVGSRGVAPLGGTDVRAAWQSRGSERAPPRPSGRSRRRFHGPGGTVGETQRGRHRTRRPGAWRWTPGGALMVEAQRLLPRRSMRASGAVRPRSLNAVPDGAAARYPGRRRLLVVGGCLVDRRSGDVAE